jgi:hypothetical protein
MRDICTELDKWALVLDAYQLIGMALEKASQYEYAVKCYKRMM